MGRDLAQIPKIAKQTALKTEKYVRLSFRNHRQTREQVFFGANFSILKVVFTLLKGIYD
jgi:hypothetical protein